MPLDACLFDYGNTLVSTRLNWKRIIPENLSGLSRVLREHFDALDCERLQRDFLFMRACGRKRAEEDWIETRAIDSLRAALALQGRTAPDALLERAVDGYFEAEEQAYPIIFGIPEALAKLKAMGLTLGVLSNATCGRLVRRALERRNMHHYFDVVVISADVGICKPSPVIAHHALSSLQAEPSRCALVGDRIEIDVACARSAGLRPVLADFFGDRLPLPERDPRPDAVVRTPDDLVNLLSSWRYD
ncbi:MAG: HAD family hydrolase [Deltaproteobacteria bacterium]|nr:HAD family hydrolase [Deltaproteobacteria bacterium]